MVVNIIYAFVRHYCYSEFDWSRYCLTIEGPVLLSEMATGPNASKGQLPERFAEVPPEDCLLSERGLAE